MRTRWQSDAAANGREPEVESQRLVEDFLAGRPQAVARITSWAWPVAAHRAWGFETAEDIVQEALLAVVRGLRTGRFSRGDLRAYVRRIAKNICISAYRRARTRGTQVGQVEELPMADPAGRRAEGLVAANDLLSRLDEACQRLILAAYYYGTPRKEIAQRLGISEGAAKVRLFRCLEKARQMIV